MLRSHGDFHRLSPLGWAGHRVAMSVCLSMCMFVTKVVIVDTSQIIRFLLKIECVNMVARILNLEGYKNLSIQNFQLI